MRQVQSIKLLYYFTKISDQFTHALLKLNPNRLEKQCLSQQQGFLLVLFLKSRDKQPFNLCENVRILTNVRELKTLKESDLDEDVYILNHLFFNVKLLRLLLASLSFILLFFFLSADNETLCFFYAIMFRTLTYSCLTKRRRNTQTKNQRCAVTHGTFEGESDELLLACTPHPVVQKSENILGPFICTEKILFNRKTRMLQNS